MDDRQPEIFVPTNHGRDALAELDRVTWSDEVHAYGKGKVGPYLHQDVRTSLARLGDPDANAITEAIEALYSNVYHQGTIYPVTAHAVPFIAAFAAAPDLWIGWSRALVVMLGAIAVASSFETSDGSRSGSFGDGVAESTRQALRASDAFLSEVAERDDGLRALHEAISALVCGDPRDRARVDRVAEVLESNTATDDGEPPLKSLAEAVPTPAAANSQATSSQHGPQGDGDSSVTPATPLDNVEVSVRTSFLFSKLGVSTVGELAQVTPEQLRGIAAGPRAMAEMNEVLALAGLPPLTS